MINLNRRYRVDTFPTTACGTPVVATVVGGIPEQVEDEVNGFLVSPGNSEAMATRIEQLLSDNHLRWRLGDKAAESARRHFDLKRQADDYLRWYNEILERSRSKRLTANSDD